MLLLVPFLIKNNSGLNAAKVNKFYKIPFYNNVFNNNVRHSVDLLLKRHLIKII